MIFERRVQRVNRNQDQRDQPGERGEKRGRGPAAANACRAGPDDHDCATADEDEPKKQRQSPASKGDAVLPGFANVDGFLKSELTDAHLRRRLWILLGERKPDVAELA